uniref:Ubiquitin-like protease family profile domain-containing protein n=1 Tax=Glossina palpalis gambiensis TaxID=67801 RepID=A0A1B0B6J7_9MUSC
MNLLTDRGEKKSKSNGLPTVYAMNTFFIPCLMKAGYGGVKRWTRKVDIFTKDILPVPVHVGGVHWCMAIIHLKNRTIKYYDSMGTPNPNVLKALEQYLKDESMDKRKQPFDTSQFLIESVPDVPRQMNGSDCGVFSCMFAEYVTRNKEITFSQQNMEYFRQKMILEIVQGELLQ